jgi:BatD DUF11 like domain
MKAYNVNNAMAGEKMTRSGNRSLACLFGWLVLWACQAQASLSVSVDRQQVYVGDTLELNIIADGNEELSQLDYSELQQNFELLQRSTSSNRSIINGQSTHERKLSIVLTPRRTGLLRIPSFSLAGQTTRAISINVSARPKLAPQDEVVLFEAELDREQVYVQGQVLLTLRLQQAINLDSRSITELQLDNAFVKQLNQNSFQRHQNGKAWLVHEIRYAIFPEQSGTLVIPAQTFGATERLGRRGGRRVQRSTDALQIQVLPRPAAFTGGTWLPAANLKIEEKWSTPPAMLQVGESATRTIHITGTGLQGAQLPPIQFQAQEGLKYYPDQPSISENDGVQGVIGIRQDSAALVPTKAGQWSIPEIRIPWWNTQSNTLEYAVLPERVLGVAAVESSLPLEQTAQQPAAVPPIAVSNTAIRAETDSTLWKILALVATLGWLVTMVLLLRSRASAKTPSEAIPTEQTPGEREVFKQLMAACASDNAQQARNALINWCAQRFPEQAIHSLDDVKGALNDPQFNTLATQLDHCLYSNENTAWNGRELSDYCKKAGKQRRSAAASAGELRLYPGAA